jgi:hypothetical protein
MPDRRTYGKNSVPDSFAPLTTVFGTKETTPNRIRAERGLPDAPHKGPV